MLSFRGRAADSESSLNGDAITGLENSSGKLGRNAKAPKRYLFFFDTISRRTMQAHVCERVVRGGEDWGGQSCRRSCDIEGGVDIKMIVLLVVQVYTADPTQQWPKSEHQRHCNTPRPLDLFNLLGVPTIVSPCQGGTK